MRGRRSVFIASGLLLGLWGCKDPAAGKPKAEVSEPAHAEAPAPAAEPAAAAAGAAEMATLAFSGEDSSIAFVGSKVTGSHDGKFHKFTGTVELPKDGPLEKGHVSLEIQMASVEADAKKLTGHLQTGDFFLVEQHPTATFHSTSVKKAETDGATHTVTGDLTLRGTKKSITFPAKISKEGDAVSIAAEFSINRKDFGIVYAGKPDDLIRDNVLIKLAIKATPKPS